MFLGEMLGIRETCKEERRRVLLIGSRVGDDVWQMTRTLAGFLEEGLNTEVDCVRDAALIVDAIDGKGDSEGKIQASLVIVGQEARQYYAGRNMITNVDGSGLIGCIREECRKRGIPLVRYRRNPYGSYEYYGYYPDKRENEIDVLPSSK